MNTKHTPMPYVAKHSGTGDATIVANNGWKNKNGSPFNPTIVDRIDWDTADFIVTACNSHEALVGALERIAEIAMDDGRLSVNHIGQAITQNSVDAAMAVTRGYFISIHDIARSALALVKEGR